MSKRKFLGDLDLAVITGGKSVMAISGNPQVAHAHGGSNGVPTLPQKAHAGN